MPKVSKVLGEWFQNEKPCKRNQTVAVVSTGVRLQAEQTKQTKLVQREWCQLLVLHALAEGDW